MSDRPNGAATVAAPAIPHAGVAGTRPEHTEREVANVLAGLLDGPDETDAIVPANDDGPEANDNFTESEAEDSADDVAADESPPSDEEAEGEEEAAAPRIDPPAGWNAKDREAWSSLPPAVQETIRRRDTEMSARLTRGTQEQAERDREWTSRLETANADRAQYVQNLQVFRSVLMPEAQAFDNVDWQRLSVEQPAEYVRLQQQRDAMRERLGLIQHEVGRIQQQQQLEQAQRQAEAQRRGHARLVERMPEFADPAQAQKLGTELGAYLRRRFGFSDQEIASVVDDRAIELGMVAMRAEERQGATERANTKRAPTPAPQVQRPGSSRRVVEGDSARHRMTQLSSRFDKTRSVKDAAAILAEWLP